MKDKTRILHAGRHPHDFGGAVNPPVFRTSTVLYPTVAAMRERYESRYDTAMFYGRWGTPTSAALEEAVAELEGGYRAIAVNSGLSAITAAISAFVGAGDHILVTDSVYGPTREFCNTTLARYGVTTTYYDPAIEPRELAELITENTRVLFCESPGSLTLEMQDIPALSAVARDHNLVVIADNTWATPIGLKPFEKGVDISIHAGTKYIVGHSDAMMGVITTTEEHYKTVRDNVVSYGFVVGTEEAWLALRGLRTMALRLERHLQSALEIAKWFAARPEVRRVIFPPLEGDAGHEIFKRDYIGGCGLLGVELKPCADSAVESLLNDLELFNLGFSWGGYESLVIWANHVTRTATKWEPEGPYLRFHIGLEDTQDLINDLESGFARLGANNYAAAISSSG